MSAPGRRVGWLDASNGISGDMLLGACLDAGAELAQIQQAVDGLKLPEPVTIGVRRARRGGIDAARIELSSTDSTVQRSPEHIMALLTRADLADAVRESAASVFRSLATAEARVHGIPESSVHFHEVGAVDSLVDIVGTAAALHALGIERLECSPIALGGGRIQTAHGALPLPGPAVLELLRAADAPGFGGPVNEELATPTGVAIAVTLADTFGAMPLLAPERIGVGAGRRDPAGHTNVTRLVIGHESTVGPTSPELFVVDANVDDLDPRLWPAILASLLNAGALDAWLTPILMKKGRPAHTLSALVGAAALEIVEAEIFSSTSTIGLRRYPVRRTVLDREEHVVDVLGGRVRVKVARMGGAIVNVNPEFDDVLELASTTGVPPKVALDAARAAAAANVR